MPLRSRFELPFDTSCSPYEILDISDEATPEEIKRKYRQLSLCEHPNPTAFAVVPVQSGG